MTTRFHINKHGVPAPCRAREGNCPLGGAETHFTTIEDAQQYANEVNERQFSLLPTQAIEGFKVAETEEDGKVIEERMAHLVYRDEQKRKSTNNTHSNYVSRCEDAEWLPNYSPNNEKTSHYQKDRTGKEKRLEETFGRGNLIGYYRVNHLVNGLGGSEQYANQITEVRDNGRIVIYDFKDGRKVTTFMAHEERLEVMMLHSGQIPNEDVLKTARENFLKESAYRKKHKLRNYKQRA